MGVMSNSGFGYVVERAMVIAGKKNILTHKGVDVCVWPLKEAHHYKKQQLANAAMF